MNILLRPNLDKKNSVSCTNQTVDFLLQHGVTPMLEHQYRPHLAQQQGCLWGEFRQLLPSCDILMPIGGDGTILHAVKHAVRADKPVIGINTGRVGFLTQIEGWELDRLELLVQGRYTIEERMLIQVDIAQGDGAGSYLALNDIIISPDIRRLVEIGVYSEDRLIVQHRADGLIMATPTGSTGYSLSAGGSVVDPSFSAILMTAVCPYSAYNRSLILPPDKTYHVRLESHIGRVDIQADGEDVASARPGQEVQIKRCGVNAKLINLGLRDFYSNLREKLLLRR